MRSTICLTLLMMVSVPAFGMPPELGVDGIHGFLVYGVKEGSPAERAGLRRGDLLVEFREISFETIRRVKDFREFLGANHREQVPIRYYRYVGTGTDELAEGMALVVPDPSLGVSGASVFLVHHVDAGSRGSSLGIQRGDYLTSVHRIPFGEASATDWEAALSGLLTVRVWRYDPNAVEGHGGHQDRVLTE